MEHVQFESYLIVIDEALFLQAFRVDGQATHGITSKAELFFLRVNFESDVVFFSKFEGIMQVRQIQLDLHHAIFWDLI